MSSGARQHREVDSDPAAPDQPNRTGAPVGGASGRRSRTRFTVGAACRRYPTALALFTHGYTVRIEHGHGPDLVGTARIGRSEFTGDLVNLIARRAVHDIEAQ
jgi:hypothetical protein